MRDSVRGEGGGVSSDAWPAVHSPQLTVTLTVSYNFSYIVLQWMSAVHYRVKSAHMNDTVPDFAD